MAQTNALERRGHKTQLIYVDDELPGIARRKSGDKWAYFDAAGERIADRDEIDRLNAIALPPAYTDAWFCPAGNGHILATGTDAKGRKQYRYHPDFRAQKEGEKFDGVLLFGELLPLVRKRVETDLGASRPTKDRALASIVRLLDLGAIRIGNECYTKSNASFGATTLRRRHAEVRGDTLKLSFKAKSGKHRTLTVSDRGLARFVKSMQDLPGQHLFRYLDPEGGAHDIGSTDVNAYLCATMGEHFTAKNFRTWHASVLAYDMLAHATGAMTLKVLTGGVAEHLGNTPAVTRRSYIHPAVIDLVDHQLAWRQALKLPRRTHWLSREERGLLALLEAGPSAGELLAAA